MMIASGNSTFEVATKNALVQGPSKINRKAKEMVFNFFTNIFLWPLYFCSHLVPRSKNVWVFGSFRGTFVDNSKYLFLQQHQLKVSSPIIPVWITKDISQSIEMRKSGYKSYWYLSIRGIYFCLRASVYVYSWTPRDINFWLSGGAMMVSLWHGLPFKKIGKDNYESKTGFLNGALKDNRLRSFFQLFLYPSQNHKSHYFLSTPSKEISAIFNRAFSTEHIVNAIYPRVEHFLLPEKEKMRYINSISTNEEKDLIDKFKRFDAVWVYMPTFRDNWNDKQIMYSKDAFDFDKMNAILKKRNILLLIKYHYVAMVSIPDKEKYSNIIFIDSKTDMYLILPFTSGLITDYSSIFFDYMLLRKPILFYVFDIDSYQNNSRGFYYPLDEVSCGMKINNFKDLCNWFKKGDFKTASTDYDPYIRRFWGKTEKPYLLEQLYQVTNN